MEEVINFFTNELNAFEFLKKGFDYLEKHSPFWQAASFQDAGFHANLNIGKGLLCYDSIMWVITRKAQDSWGKDLVIYFTVDGDSMTVDGFLEPFNLYTIAYFCSKIFTGEFEKT